LKALRRGIEDAGLLALAAQVDPDKTFDISQRIVVAALDEVTERSAARMEFRPSELLAARSALRRMIANAVVPPSPNPLQVARGVGDIRSRRAIERRVTGAGQEYLSPVLVLLVLPGFLFGLGYAVAFLLRRQARHSLARQAPRQAA